MSSTSLLTKVDSMFKKVDVNNLHDGDEAFARLYGSFEEQLEIALMPGPRDNYKYNHCWIKRNKKTSTFYLCLAPTPNFNDNGKFLLAARRFRTCTFTEYIISLDADDFSQGSKGYVGKIRSNFLRTSFTVYDSQTPQNGAKPSNSKACCIFASKQISPQIPAGNFEVGKVSYKLNISRSRGPRKMVSTLQCPSPDSKPCEVTKMVKKPNKILKNKTPRWHEHLNMWCLNFRGRVTVASVKNFQLVATIDQSQPSGKGDQETVLLQFGKVGDDTFTMDYKHPLSAFQAFAICLTSFGIKLACE